jgi:hypothetical protein
VWPMRHAADPSAAAVVNGELPETSELRWFS